MRKLIYHIFGNPIPREKGLRGTSDGKLYIDKKVFYKRPEVKEAIEKMESSMAIKEQLELSN